MRVRLNRFEKVAGAFVGLALMGFISFSLALVIKQGWFESRVDYYTFLENAAGVHAGTTVEMAGLKVGSVDFVEFIDESRIKVGFSVFERFKPRIREGVYVQVLRPFVIGDKVLELTYSSKVAQTAPSLPSGTYIDSDEIFSFVDVMNGRKLAPYLKTIDTLASQIKELLDAFAQSKGSSSVVKTTKDLREIISALAGVSKQLNTMLPQAAENAPRLAQDMQTLVSNLAVLTEEFKKLTPAIAAVAPDLPRTSRRAVEALDEAVVVLKAMQKTFVLRGSAEEVRAEERVAEKSSTDSRKPASSPATAP